MRSEMIRASAGSGKTHRLAMRYISLLAMDVPAERIIALTFTRKAAGEFFSRIAGMLAAAADEQSNGPLLLLDVEGESVALDRESALTRLRSFIWSTPVVHLHTIDQFFYRVLSQYAFEFGLPAGFAVTDPGDLRMEVNRLFGRLLQPRTSHASARALMEVIKEASHGEETASITRVLHKFIDQCHVLYLQAPDGKQWGHADTIWGSMSASPFLDLSPEEHGESLREFSKLIEKQSLPDAVQEKWQSLGAIIRDFDPFGPIDTQLAGFLEKVGKARADFEFSGEAGLMLERRRIPIRDARHMMLLDRAIQPVIARTWAVRLRQTQGLFQLIREFENHYDSLLRRRGILTFSDLQFLLDPLAVTDGPPTRLLSQKPSDDRRLNIDFRLDARFDHWLLDEFQDTSRIQWNILENLLDEVVQDTSGQRSLFVVGDVKQSIYGWRGGDHRLFDLLTARYAAHGDEGLHESPLNDSWRSGPEIISFVNAVFDPAHFIDDVLGPEVSRQWHWAPHTTARMDRPGHVAVLSTTEPVKLHPNDQKITPARRELVMDILRGIEPAGRGMSCAVLVRTNSEALEMTRFLRENNIPVTLAMDIPIAADNLIVPAVLSLIQALIHPKDSFARWHFMMSPLVKCLPGLTRDWDSAAASCLDAVHRMGLSAWLAWVLQELGHKGISLDSFHARRGAQLIEAARAFEKSPSTSLDAFLDFMESWTVQEPGSPSHVQVLTAHKSKGLGFDMVILPQLNSHLRSSGNHSLLVKRKDDGSVEWIVDKPPKPVSSHDPVTSSVVQAMKDDGCFEELCLFYVASTRAKKALYLVIDPPTDRSIDSDSGIIRYEDHLLMALRSSGHRIQQPRLCRMGQSEAPVHAEFGSIENLPPGMAADNLSHENPVTKRKDTEPAAIPTSIEFALFDDQTPSAHAGTGHSRLIWTSPSRGENWLDHRTGAGSLFNPLRQESLRLGTMVHKLLQAIDWMHPETASLSSLPDSLMDLWKTSGLDRQSGFNTAAAAILSWLQNQDNVAWFLQPPRETALWKEKPFEMVEGNRWYSGIIDRVHLHAGQHSSGAPDHVTLLEFKTDAAFNPDKHQDQIRIYKIAISRILNIPDTRITAHLLNIPLQ